MPILSDLFCSFWCLDAVDAVDVVDADAPPGAWDFVGGLYTLVMVSSRVLGAFYIDVVWCSAVLAYGEIQPPVYRFGSFETMMMTMVMILVIVVLALIPKMQCHTKSKCGDWKLRFHAFVANLQNNAKQMRSSCAVALGNAQYSLNFLKHFETIVISLVAAISAPFH